MPRKRFAARGKKDELCHAVVRLHSDVFPVHPRWLQSCDNAQFFSIFFSQNEKMQEFYMHDKMPGQVKFCHLLCSHAYLISSLAQQDVATIRHPGSTSTRCYKLSYEQTDVAGGPTSSYYRKAMW